ncbi:hypothetical protein Aph01nite_19480 [Acrocarpospora phusangensis]|uniref:CoA transferase n=1 Tax=Acrocarpospora phusangensis TaxID=1070424 RepID=A0A919QA51_9ACTN|nr:CoA transferase [Acrocarpospora phusangensis]GIH23638.1 hypothetical protein Aph01nite_19480 [Acrocarpospora phusangensis]
MRGFRVVASGPPALTGQSAHRLGLLGADVSPGQPAGPGRIIVSGAGTPDLRAEVSWSATPSIVDEATAQAATGVAHVHGRSAGQPRAIACDYLTTLASALTIQGLLAALVGRARGADIRVVSTSVDLAGLLAVSQYLAAATAEDDEAVPLAPGGPPFVTADGVRFEVETLDATVWVTFWRSLGVAERLAGSAWRSFQFRYATACSPLPPDLHEHAEKSDWSAVRAAAEKSGASVCPVHDTPGPIADAPWTLWPRGRLADRTATAPGRHTPLAGITVLEAGRRIQAPMAAHLLRLLGARVVRVEPPGGDPLRGMPPTCGDISARWLALNRGKDAAEIDIKSAAGRADLLDLVADADVFLHNWAPGAAERLGLDDADLRKVNPGLVYAYTSGWAGRIEDAPLGTDFMVQARSGVGAAVRGDGEPPAPSLMTLLDVLGGLLGTEVILAALLLREREGRGVRAESSLLGAADLLLKAPRSADRRPIRTRDGWIMTADGTRRDPRLLTALTSGDALAALHGTGVAATAVTTSLDRLPHDPRFSSHLYRDAHGALAVAAPWRFA